MNQLVAPILAIDLGIIIQAIVFLVILASGVAKMFRESKEVQRRTERQQQQRPPQRPRPEQMEGGRIAEAQEARGARAPEAPQETIRSEVEEFLRRVGQEMDGGQQERRQPQQQARRPRTPQIEVLEGDDGIGVDDRPRQKRRRPEPSRPAPVAKPPRTIAPAPVTREGIERGESVAQHVAEHLKRGDFDERASHLGEDLAQTDERLEARLHRKFDHGLGSLAARRQAREAEDLALKNVPPPGSLAGDVLNLLSSPQGVQQAIVINEVLKRPIDRW